MIKKICVLEDTEAILELVHIILEEEGYEVYGFDTVTGFNENIAVLSPDLFLLDVMLPDGSGLDVCKELKEAENTGHIPVIMMTANSRISSMKDSCPADEFIAKPFDIDHLVATIKQLIANSSVEQSI
jgi:DNA-binding response OmpR family regulator